MKKMSCGVRIDIPAYLPMMSHKDMLNDFTKFCRTNLQHSKRTVVTYKSLLRTFLKRVKRKRSVTRRDIRDFLDRYSSEFPNKNTYSNMLKALKIFFREYLESNIMDNFRFPRLQFSPKNIPSKEQLRIFYSAIPTTKDRALFLMYATSGARRKEILDLTLEDVDLQKRMFVPKIHEGSTKKSWVGFFNEECLQILRQYLDECTNNPKCTNKTKLFSFRFKEKSQLWRQARKKTGINITPQVLRDWFCVEMAELGVPDRYVDAFCGRAPQSILARHYTDYSPERLKRIYDRANLIGLAT